MRKSLEKIINKFFMTAAFLSFLLPSSPLKGYADIDTKENHLRPSIVEVKKQEDGWNLLVNGKKYIVRGMVYEPTPVGCYPHVIKHDWMSCDQNNNGKADAPYKTFIDANRNNIQDSNEPAEGDFAIMKKMGVNTIRIYNMVDFEEKNAKKILNDLHKNYGIMVLVGDYLGAYTYGSGASWQEGTDYTNPEQKKRMMDSVIAMVKSYMDEPFVLMWILGNENTHRDTRTNASKQYKEYYSFVNDVAKEIHKIDKNHPVVICNTSTHFIGAISNLIPNVDIFGANAFDLDKAGNQIFSAVSKNLDKPVIITEYGADSYDNKKLQEDENLQADIHSVSWKAISSNFTGFGNMNSLGGVIFEWSDEWWKTTDPSEHDAFDIELLKQNNPNIQPEEIKRRLREFVNPNEEYLGVCSLGDGKNNFLRQPKKIFYLYRSELWKEKQ